MKRLAAMALALVISGTTAAAPVHGGVMASFRAERATLLAFIHAYNRGDQQGALSYFTTTTIPGNPVTATDCDYRRQRTIVYVSRKGLTNWLKARFADHDHLTIAHVRAVTAPAPLGALVVTYARRTSDTLRRLGFPTGIVPQIQQKLPFLFLHGAAKLRYFGLASPSVPAPPA